MRTLQAVALAVGSCAPAVAAAQVTVGTPYLAIVARYQAGDHQQAVTELAALPAAGLRDRARKDLRDLTCQVLTGIADCRRARAAKPAEFERVLEAWASSMPAAAAVHVEAAIQAEANHRRDAADVHRTLALEVIELMDTELTAPPPAAPEPAQRDRPAFTGPTVTTPDSRVARRAETVRLVMLLAIWLQQLRGDLEAIQGPLAKAQQRFPDDSLVALAVGSLHEAHAAPHALVERSAGRQGDVAKWRQEERAYRLEQARAAYGRAVALEPGLAEAQLRLGRVLLLAGRVEPALQAFQRVPEATSDRRWRYLAEMFRAGAAESAGDAAEARTRYLAALETWPGSQSAQLALSRLSAAAGDWPAAQARLGALAPQDGGRPEDPWWAYGFGQAWRIEAGVAALRKLVPR